MVCANRHTKGIHYHKIRIKYDQTANHEQRDGRIKKEKWQEMNKYSEQNQMFVWQ